MKSQRVREVYVLFSVAVAIREARENWLHFMEAIIQLGHRGGTYIEPLAGGAGISD